MIRSVRKGEEYLSSQGVHKEVEATVHGIRQSCLMGGVTELDEHTMTVTEPPRHLIPK